MADTQWQSMFDAGTCHVAIYYEGASEVPGSEQLVTSGEVAKGGSLSGTLNSKTYQVDVDADGIVTLTSDDTAGGWRVDVLPQYDVSSIKTRITALSAGSSNSTGYMFDDVGAADKQAGDEFVAVTFASGVADPSEAEFPVHTSTDGSLVGVMLLGAR